MSWVNIAGIVSKQFKCGFCNNTVASSRGYYSSENQHIYVCSHCSNPTYWGNGKSQLPGILPGNNVAHLPKDLESLYDEARQCTAAGAFTGSVLLCRKLLMNIGVSQGAAEGEAFISYVNFLADAGYIPPNGRGWVDHIRKKGNEATHEIALMTQDDAHELLAFAEMLMKFIYEFPSKVPSA
ncbi:DUF4145 domain-containing protein [Pseudomonas sp. RU47]|uniref:DUF4145 domain-containing protein n=1 Tax=unclassified Pseudomonas TaxID=196821 RepID=UPI0006D6D84D|nr:MULTISPECIES: DUF4145 domain-containing protein [unclassified Pseudomonas]AZZ76610.1 DUF4145 domain-containing protein [Pseudomonas sp. RU47]KPG94636.1 hypothetical protein AK821_18680 [Pseudomonas sp. RIT-PI-r]